MLAYWLHHYDIPVVVIEQAKEIRRDGYAIDFLGTGYEVASRMGLIDRLAAQQIPFEALVYVSADGKQIAKLDVALMRSISDGKYMGLMHATLEEVCQTHTFQMYVEPRRMAAAFCTPQEGEILTFFMYQSTKPEHVPREQRLARLREVFAGMGWLIYLTVPWVCSCKAQRLPHS